MQQTLFLDFDGVLHPNLCARSAWFSRMPLLEQALAGTDVRIVISSSWRFHHDYTALARRFPVSLRLLLDGTTGAAVVGRHARHQEILAWLQRYGAGLPEARWRALDDAAFEFPAPCAQLVHCDGATGMTLAEVQRLREWLGSG
jgi:hypothetical protein